MNSGYHLRYIVITTVCARNRNGLPVRTFKFKAKISVSYTKKKKRYLNISLYDLGKSKMTKLYTLINVLDKPTKYSFSLVR